MKTLATLFSALFALTLMVSTVQGGETETAKTDSGAATCAASKDAADAKDCAAKCEAAGKIADAKDCAAKCEAAGKIADAKECSATCIKACCSADATGIVKTANESAASPFYTLDSTVSDFQLKHAQSGETKKLSDLAGEDATLVIFWNQKCPYVEGKNGASESIQDFAKRYADQGVSVVAIDSGINNDESANVQYAKNLGIPLLLNPDSGIAAKFNASYTPQTWVLDRDMKIQYSGAFQTGSGEEVQAHAENAVKDVLAGSTPTVRDARGVGCSIKYAEGARPAKKTASRPTT